jgi:predicted methyltransferase
MTIQKAALSIPGAFTIPLRRCAAILLGGSLAMGAIVAVTPSAEAQVFGTGVGIPPAAPVEGVAPYINKAVASWSRFREDIWNDPVLKPAQVTQFIGLKPGDKVADFIPGSMYWSRLFAKVVGLNGYVYPFVPQLGCRPSHPGCVAGLPSSTSIGYNLKDRPQQTLLGDPRGNGIDEAIDVADLWDFSRNMAVIWDVAEQFSVPEQLDVVWSFGHWHDLRTWDYALNMQVFLPLVFESMKPGGIFAVADYASAPGQGFAQVELLHRVDKEAVKAELVAAGFEFVGESDVLSNGADDHTSRVDENALVVRKNVDMFLMKFRKPLNAPKDRRVSKAQYGDILDSNTRSLTAPPESGGGVWTNADGTYQEYNAGVGRWFFDAHGNMCLWNEYPRPVRALLGCHVFHTEKFDEVYAVHDNEREPSKEVLRKQRSYVSPETAIKGQGGRSGGSATKMCVWPSMPEKCHAVPTP